MNYTQQAPRRKNYPPLPNEVFSLGLSPGELAVSAYLLYFEDRPTKAGPATKPLAAPSTEAKEPSNGMWTDWW